MLMNTVKHGLAIIADSYTPILLLISLFICGRVWKQGYKLYVTRLLGAAFVVYSLMFIDKWLDLWMYMDLDYSTHTAASLAMIIFISKNKTLQVMQNNSMRVRIALGISLISYAGIMKFLNYHSWADMASTAIVIGIIVNLVDKIIIKSLPVPYRS
ncbi:MAG: hypothetical protein V4732_08420 [Pseudomonadota bacterium]